MKRKGASNARRKTVATSRRSSSDVINLYSDDDNESRGGSCDVVDLTLTDEPIYAAMPDQSGQGPGVSVVAKQTAKQTPPPAKKRRRGVKHAARRRDWLADDASRLGQSAWVYVLWNGRSPYTGYSSTPWERLAQHNRGSTKSTKTSTTVWSMVMLVGPFRNELAASRFESLIKACGGRGVEPKVRAAKRTVEESGRGDEMAVYTAGEGADAGTVDAQLERLRAARR